MKNRVHLAERGKVAKVLRRPVRMAHSKILQSIARTLNTTFRVKADLFWKDSRNIVIPELVSCHLFQYGYFEEGLTRILLELLEPGATYFDIGAHFGYYTSLSSHLVGNDGQVHAFEPVPTTFEILKLNTKHMKNVILNNQAVSSTNGVIELQDYGWEYSAYNSSRAPRIDENLRKSLRSETVVADATSLDSYVKDSGVQPDFVKIDAESAEWDIFQGARRTLMDARPIVSLEAGDFDVAGVPPSRDLVLYMLELNYEVYEYGSLIQPLVKHEIRARYNYDNLFFIPK